MICTVLHIWVITRGILTQGDYPAVPVHKYCQIFEVSGHTYPLEI
jgi:hypothetical protein